jgi:hypothetical protein
MSGEEFERDETLGKVGMDRRAFVKKLLVGGVFAAPVVASFSMADLVNATVQPHFTSYVYSSYTPGSHMTHGGYRGYSPYFHAYSAYQPFGE